MDNVRKILTPSAVWNGFKGDLPLKDSKVHEMTYDGITYAEVYFSGREINSSRVRIYGLYARPNPLPSNRKIGAVLILPDFCDTINLELVNHFAKMGYAVLMVDYRGDVGDNANHTIYPSEIEYANYGKEDMFRVERDAKETCWHEWACVAKYAISYLKSRVEVDKIALIGIKQGANVGWQTLYKESRIECFVSLFGAGWQAYKGVFKSEGTDISMDDERYRWLGGVDAHVYAQYCKCPVLYLTATNSPDFDCERGIETISRVQRSTSKGAEKDAEKTGEKEEENKENPPKPEVEIEPIKCVFNYSPRLKDTIDKKSADDIALFLKKYLTKAGALTDRLYFPASPALFLAIDNEKKTAFAEVIIAEEDKLKGLTVYMSEGIADPAKRNWCQMVSVKNKNTANRKYFKLPLGGACDFINAFAVVDYKNGVSVSSRMVMKKIENPLPAIPANMLYSSRSGIDCFTVCDELSNSVGKIFFNENVGVELAECANGITGVTSRYGLLNYRIVEKRFNPTDRSIIKSDIYCEDYTKLKVGLVLIENGQKCEYSTFIELKGSKVWQKIQIDLAGLKDENRIGIKNYENIVALKFEASSRFAVNNILLI